ncbi:remodeling and spacing factor 1, partial [Musca vetustissima]|uniref:remodeling and spacing factor 1 n=1 Tax=Musca vetustissima TaxID=27455 RepID=UPI002AB739B1
MGPLQQQTSLGSSCSCANDPNFAIICAFLQKFGCDLNIDIPNFKQLLEWLTKTDEVAAPLKDLHIKLMRKNRKTVHEKSWESALSKFCFSYSAQDAWEIERFGYKNASFKVKLRVLKELLESQFERNTKFRAKILTQSAESLRSEPIGRDRLGHAYWVTQDNDSNLRIYQEHLDEDIWQVVATNREEFVNLIERLRGNEVVLPSNDIGIVDEDTSSSNSITASIINHNPEEIPAEIVGEELKLPKLSIKISNKSFNDGDISEASKKGEEVAKNKNEYSKNKDNSACDVNPDNEEVRKIGEYSKSVDSRRVEPLKISQMQTANMDKDDQESTGDNENECEEENNEDECNSEKSKNEENDRRVEPILISQKQIICKENEQNNSKNSGRKRQTSESRELSWQKEDDNNDSVRDEKHFLPDNKRYKVSKKCDDEDNTGEEDREYSEEETKTEEDIEEEDIDSAAAEEDENEEKLIEEFDDDDIPNVVVGEAITDPVLHIQGEGSGKDCESEFFNSVSYSFDDNQQFCVSDVIEDDIIFVCGEGSGTDCLIGNAKSENNVTSDSTQKDKLEVDSVNEPEQINSSHQTEGDVDLDSRKTVNEIENKETKNEIAENIQNDVEEEGTEILGSQNCTPKSRITRNLKNKTIVTIDKADEKNRKKPASTDVVGANADKDSIISKTVEENDANPPSINRKRRLANYSTQQSHINLQSESEIDINSENTEDYNNEQDLDVDEHDVGGKRLKMRQKQSNTELRKKVEAMKAAVQEDINSSSGGEECPQRRRKLTSPKKHIEKEVIKSEPTNTSDNRPSPSNNLNDSHANIVHNKTTSKTTENNPSNEDLSARDTSSTVIKQRKTLEEIIDKKLKQAHEESDAGTCPKKSVKNHSSSSKKSPVTKPLKKNLLTQIWHEENEMKSTTEKSSSTKYDKIDETTSVVDNRNNQERQRKRHSSEEADQHVITEEPEAKKEVPRNDFGVQGKTDVPSTGDSETASIGRRSTRRGNGSNITSNKPKVHDKKNYTMPESNNLKDVPANKRRESEKASSEDGSPVSVSQNKSVTKEEDATESEKASREEGPPVSAIQNKTAKKEEDATESKKKSMEKPTSKEKSPVIPEKNTSKIQPSTKKVVKGVRKQREVDTTNIIDTNDAETPVRQSRRIAQLKIREEAERRKLEEIALRTMKQELKKKKKAEKQADPTVLPPSEPSSESAESDIDTKKKVQKKKCPGKNGSWSSGSEEQEEPDEEEDEEHHHYETDPGSPLFKSDHEFSPESDIEDETQVVPTKRARTARKENDVDNEPDEEEACQKCHKSDHPEWILLCDKCDKGYHCSCLSPVLFYIPEGDWYCPPCQQEQLIKALEGQLKEFDEMVERKKQEQEEVKRLEEKENARRKEEEELSSQNKRKSKKYDNGRDNSSSDINTDPSADSDDQSNSGESEIENKKSSKNNTIDKRRRNDRRQYSGRNTRSHRRKTHVTSDSNSRGTSNSESASKSESSSSFSDSDDEPIYKLRKRRQLNVSYRLNEYDDLINSALKKEMDEVAGAGNLGRGKDISTIIEADKEEKARQKHLESSDVQVEKEEKADDSTEKGDTKNIESESEDELIKDLVQPKSTMKKKSRKLTTLDISSEGDDASDEDFKGSSVDEEDESFGSCSINSDSSLEIYKRKGNSRKKQRKAARRAFRERRRDRKFIVDNSDDDEEVQKPKSKKKRKVESDYTESELDDDDLSELSNNIDSADLCDDTTTDESDGAWRPNKRKKSKKSSLSALGKSSKAKARPSNKSKKEIYSDDDITDTDEGENDDDSNEVAGSGKQPRSQPLKTGTNPNKAKVKKVVNKKCSDEEKSFSDSGDSTRRTRGRRYAYIEDFDDDSSDGGIKPGVKRPDTPPEEREKFIKRQEEIKRMLAEKNAEGAKLVATPRLTPIKSEPEKEKKSPSKSGGDALSTVPMSVIRQAKVLDIDYLQRRGEPLDDSLNDVGDVDDEFDDADLPDDLPDDMDEDAIARMVEDEEDFAAVTTRDLPPPDEIIRTTPASIKTKPKAVENIPTTDKNTELAAAPLQPVITASPSGLQEPVRKRFPMPTMHPPLLRHQQHDNMHGVHNAVQRNITPHLTHLLQNALSSPVNQSFPSSYSMPPTSQNNQSLISRMTNNAQVQSSPTPVNPPCRTSSPLIVKSTQQINMQSQNKASAPTPESEVKPRGRRKKITPLRDTLQKQQTAAAVAAAASASTSASIANSSTGIIKSPYSFKTSDSVTKESPPTKVPEAQGNITAPIQPRSLNTIQAGHIFAGSEGFYGAPPSSRIPPSNTQRHRGPPPIPQGHLLPHSAVRHTYGPPPPLKGTITTPPSSSSSNIRPQVHLPPFIGSVPPARHSGSHLNVYGPPIYGNPTFVH